jgi:hypothetical protein
LPVKQFSRWQKCDGQDYGGNRILRTKNNAVAGSRQILRIDSRIISSGYFKLSTHLTSRIPSLSTYQRSFVFGLAAIRGRSGASSGITIRRTTIHLLARLAIAATWTSSAAAFDAVHISRMTGVVVSRSHLLELRRHEARPNCSLSLSVVQAPPFLTTGRRFLAKSQPALQREVEVQPGESEEMGKQ